MREIQITPRGKRVKPLSTSRRPGYSIQFHPRRFNKPLVCQSGVHQFSTRFDERGVPMLVCSKCGAGIGKGLYEKTWTKGDIKKIAAIGERKPRTKRQIQEDALKRLRADQKARRKRMHSSIAKFVKRRMDLV